MYIERKKQNFIVKLKYILHLDQDLKFYTIHS